MPFGTVDASEVYQRVLSEHFEGLAEVIVDDLLIWGVDENDHDAKLKLVLDKAREINLKLNPKKAEFSTSEVSYVGHIIGANGVRPDNEKIRAIVEMPKPTD